VYMKNKRIWILFLSVLSAVIVVSLLSLGDNLVYFHTPAEVYEKQKELNSQTFRVGALVKPESVHWDPQTLKLSFVITDLNGHEISVMYAGSPPDMFKENQGVVVEGSLSPTSDSKSLAF